MYYNTNTILYTMAYCSIIVYNTIIYYIILYTMIFNTIIKVIWIWFFFLSKHLVLLYMLHGYPGQRGDSCPRLDGTRWNKFYPTTQKGVQTETYELFVSGILYFLLLDHVRPCVTETVEKKTANKGEGYCTSYTPATKLTTPGIK